MPGKSWIPNGLTLGNLGCGAAAIYLVLHPESHSGPWTIAILMGISMLCDFLDGFAARALKVSSPLGKELDSLADMVTFGLLPGLLVMVMIESGLARMHSARPFDEMPSWHEFLPWVGLFVPLMSALRLAKFNVDTRQTDKFLGLATPANALFILSLFLIQSLDQPNEYLQTIAGPFWKATVNSHWTWPLVGWMVHPFMLPVLTIVFSLLLVTELPLIAFKFKGYGWGKNWPKYVLLGISITLSAVFTYRAGPFILAAYFVLSLIDAKRINA